MHRLLEVLDVCAHRRCRALAVAVVDRLEEHAVRIEVERERAAWGAWYECFPRSCARQPNRHGTFHDLVARLPDIAGMGFDVLYLPPIHPIGRTHRKGAGAARPCMVFAGGN